MSSIPRPSPGTLISSWTWTGAADLIRLRTSTRSAWQRPSRLCLTARPPPGLPPSCSSALGSGLCQPPGSRQPASLAQRRDTAGEPFLGRPKPALRESEGLEKVGAREAPTAAGWVRAAPYARRRREVPQPWPRPHPAGGEARALLGYVVPTLRPPLPLQQSWDCYSQRAPWSAGDPFSAESSKPRGQPCLPSSRAAVPPTQTLCCSLSDILGTRKRIDEGVGDPQLEPPLLCEGRRRLGDSRAGGAVGCAGSSPGPLGWAHRERPVPLTAGHRQPACREY